MRVLLDQNVPWKLLNLPGGHDISTAHRMGWSDLANGDLIRAAEEAGFDVLITADRSIRYQQNWSGRRLCLIVQSTNNWPVISRNVRAIVAALDALEPGGWIDVACEG